MKICVWRTRHEIADTVANAINDGSQNRDLYLDTDEILPDEADVHIGYGILRGMDNVFRVCQKAGKPFIHIDRGYWKPGHYDGYYRVSLNGTQQTFGFDKLEPDYERWDKLGIDVLPRHVGEHRTLVCPPTQHVQDFFNRTLNGVIPGDRSTIRPKGSEDPIDWKKYDLLYTFNSSVGWEALRQGIEVVSDPTHSIVGAYQNLFDKPLHVDVEARRKLFAIMANLQLTLEEMRSGKLWMLVEKLVNLYTSTSAGIVVKE